MQRNTLFEDRRAIFLAAVCGQAYEQFTHPEGNYQLPEFYEEVSTLQAKSITDEYEKIGFILESDDRIIVAFRGTITTADWLSDVIAKQSRYKCVRDSGLTHVGISSIYYSVREQILKVLSTLPPDKEVNITGHSLGGALATLCALDVAVNSKFHLPIVYTFGSPRVGDPEFVKSYANKIENSYRVHNTFDAVTLLPPPIYKLPKREKTYYYMHVPHSIALPFLKKSVSLNHVLGSYFTELSKRNPGYSEQLRLRNPHFCPAIDARMGSGTHLYVR